MRTSHRCAVLAAGLGLAAILAAPSPARADGFSGQRFTPAIGAAGGLLVERPVVPLHLGFGAGLFINYSLNAVVLRDRASGVQVAEPLRHAMSFDLLGSIGFFDFWEVALDVPIPTLTVSDVGPLRQAT